MGKFESGAAKKSECSRGYAWEPALKAVTVLVTLALMGLLIFWGVQKYVWFAGFQPVLLTGEQIDLRDARITVSEYEKLRQQHPEAEILWSVPVSGSYFESGARKITVIELSEEDVSAFVYFTQLESVDARKCTNHSALMELEKAFPNLQVLWNVHLEEEVFSRDQEMIDLRKSNADYETLESILGCFLPGVQIRLNSEVLREEEIQTLKESFPELQISWGIDLMGQRFASSAEKLSFAGQELDVDALTAAADQFFHVTEINLTGCGCSLKELLEIHSAYPDAFIRSELTLHGVELTTDMTEIDFSGIEIKNTEEIEQAVTLMPMLEKVIMSDCGIPDEDMDALNKRHENVRFVWTVYFSVYSLRTDALAFCASNLPSHNYIGMKLNSKQLEPLKYCTDLIALDLGHMYYKDLSFLENMHKLQYLILVDARYTDISVIAQMKDLYYLELFKNNLDDLTPLLECKNLRHLNIGYTRGFDYTPLKEMTWLERLWFPGHGLTKEQKQEIIDALPDTEVYMPNYDADGSTGGTWRTSDVYFEMRNLFDMFYQPGGTGTKKN